MKIDIDDSQAAKKLSRQAFIVSDKHLKKAEVRSVNRVLRGARTEISRAIREGYRMKSSDIKDAMTLRRASATQSTPTGIIRIEDKPLPIIRFGSPNQTRAGLSVTVRRGRRQTIKGGFIVESMGGHAFIRTTEDSLPIRKLFGPSARMLAPFAIKKSKGAVDERMVKEFDRNVNREIRKAWR